MYTQHFGFTRRPFLAAPACELYVPVETMETARERLFRCIERAEGVGLLVGPAGTGKSLLCCMLAEHFRRQHEIIHLACGRIGNRRHLLQAMLYELNQPYRDMAEGELRLALVDYLRRERDERDGVLVVVDEAHSLPFRVLEELRLLLNLVVAGRPRVRLVLAGGPLLEERFAHPKLEPFSQRIVARCYLDALSHREHRQYIRGQLTAAGGDAERIFPDEAIDAVYQATGGVPRLTNQVADHALVLAFANGMDSVTGAVAEEAWADLQQLPTPWHESAASASGGDSGSVIEFGSLVDDRDGPSPQTTSPPDTLPREASAEEPGAAAVEFGALPGETPREAAAAADSPALPDEAPTSPVNFAAEEFQTADPLERLEMVERTLDGLQGDYQPGEVEKPSELEVVFEDWGNPFEESFEEEIPIEPRAFGQREEIPAKPPVQAAADGDLEPQAELRAETSSTPADPVTGAVDEAQPAFEQGECTEPDTVSEVAMPVAPKTPWTQPTTTDASEGLPLDAAGRHTGELEAPSVDTFTAIPAVVSADTLDDAVSEQPVGELGAGVDMPSTPVAAHHEPAQTDHRPVQSRQKPIEVERAEEPAAPGKADETGGLVSPDDGKDAPMRQILRIVGDLEGEEDSAADATPRRGEPPKREFRRLFSRLRRIS